MTLSKADQYVEDYKRFEEYKEPSAPSFDIDGVPKVIVDTRQGDLLFNSNHLKKEHALDLAQWIIDTYSVPEEPKPDWRIPVNGKVYKAKAGDKVILIVDAPKTTAVRCRDDYVLGYDRFPFYCSKGTSDYDIVGFWEET